MPRGTVHNFRNTAETPSRILVGFTPAGIEGFFRESGRPATDDGPAPPLDDDEIARTTAAAPNYGIEGGLRRLEPALQGLGLRPAM